MKIYLLAGFLLAMLEHPALAAKDASGPILTFASGSALSYANVRIKGSLASMSTSGAYGFDIRFTSSRLGGSECQIRSTSNTLARVCAGDFRRLCANEVPVPAIEDFREGGPINQCLKEKLRQLSNACWYVIIEDGR